jgi:hypothetical protein
MAFWVREKKGGRSGHLTQIWRLAILGIVSLVLSIAAAVVFYSPTTIIPPSQPEEPLLVYVVDYGYHSRLVLPDRQGRLVQYTYGDWQYLALQHQTVITALEALLRPTLGTLGRRYFADFFQLDQAVGRLDHQRLLAVAVDKAQSEGLRSRLDAWFEDHLDTEVVHPSSGLHFVRVDQHYTAIHNSNHELVAWLRDLGCQVKGFVAWPNFQVKPLALALSQRSI